MRRHAPALVTTVVAALLLAACGEKPPVPKAEPALERPVYRLEAPPAGGRALLRIPRSALVDRGGISGVFVLAPAGEPPLETATAQARFRMVKVGKSFGDEVEVLAGLLGNETLVLGDLAPVHDGTPITLKQDIRR